jgi:hypothetical protein
MTEPKKRGRPPKAKPEPKVEGADAAAVAKWAPKPCVVCGRVEGHYDDCQVGMGVLTMGQAESYKRAAAAHRLMAATTPAQAYARRVWDGQSPEVHREERLRRVKLALDGQGLSMEGVEL